MRDVSLIRKIYSPHSDHVHKRVQASIRVCEGEAVLAVTSLQLSSLITCLRPSEHKEVIILI